MGRLAVALIVSAWVIPISMLVNRIVPDPYMDEIFHIPQAQQYCRGDFRSWDPMITTPPGLYYISIAYISSLFPGMWLTKGSPSALDLCSTSILRSVNGALAVICSVLIYDIIIHLKPGLDKTRATLHAILVSLYPVHWFFTFLYYTDVASVTAVLAMYLASLKRHYWTSALLGALGVLLRQTNIIWMLFVAVASAIDYSEFFSRKQCVQSDMHVASYPKKIATADKSSNLRRRSLVCCNSQHSNSSYVSGMSSGPPNDALGFADEFWAVFLKLWLFKYNIIATFAPFVVVLVSFVAFVLWNGSVVLGAKEAHVVSPHFAQIMYFGLVAAAAIAPVHFSLSQASSVCKSFMKNKTSSLFQWLMSLMAGLAAVHLFSVAHPYLLADNRHYTFYIWRKIINAHWVAKYLLVPFYIYSWLSIFNILGKFQKKIWSLSFFLACAAVLVPAPLIEFRYYTVPFLFLILHSPIPESSGWVLTLTLYIAVNVFTMVMFLFRPFQWAHEPGIQRFIW